MTDSEYAELWTKTANAIRHDVPPCDLEDYVQDAIVATWLAQPDSPVAWAKTCARNAVKDWWRTLQHNPRPKSLDCIWWLTSPDKEEPQRTVISRETITTLFETLDERYREIVYCMITAEYGHYHDSPTMSYRQRNSVGQQVCNGEMKKIADYLNMPSAAAAKQKLWRARTQAKARQAQKILLE